MDPQSFFDLIINQNFQNFQQKKLHISFLIKYHVLYH